MAEEKPLPKLRKTPQTNPLLADELAKAVSEGRLEEFMDQEIPDNEHSRKLVSMMMGMTGMMPPGEIASAAQAGDVKGLTDLLAKEHEKRTDKPGTETNIPSPEQKTLDDLIQIASDNNVSVDWLVMRALSLYITEYRKTGRL